MVVVMTGMVASGAPAAPVAELPYVEGIQPDMLGNVHRIAVLALDQVVAFDLSIPAQVFGHPDERNRYALTVCAERAGPVATSSGFEVVASRGLEALRDADTRGRPGDGGRRPPSAPRPCSPRSAPPTRAAPA